MHVRKPKCSEGAPDVERSDAPVVPPSTPLPPRRNSHRTRRVARPPRPEPSGEPQAVMREQYASLRGARSLPGRLAAEFPDVDLDEVTMR